MAETIYEKVCAKREQFIAAHGRQPNQVWLGHQEYQQALDALTHDTVFAIEPPIPSQMTLYGMRVLQVNKPSEILCGIGTPNVGQITLAPKPETQTPPLKYNWVFTDYDGKPAHVEVDKALPAQGPEKQVLKRAMQLTGTIGGK